MLAERPAGRGAEAVTTLKTPSGRPASVKMRASASVVRGGVFRRLDHRRAARGEDGGQALAHDHQRVVEGRAIAHDADRLAQRVVEVAPFHGDHGIAARQRQAGVIAEEIRQAAQLRACLIDGAAVVHGLKRVKLFEMRLERIGQLVDQPGSRSHLHLGPARAAEGLARILHGAINIGGIRMGNAGNDHAGRGIADVQQRVRRRRDFTTADVEAMLSIDRAPVDGACAVIDVSGLQGLGTTTHGADAMLGEPVQLLSEDVSHHSRGRSAMIDSERAEPWLSGLERTC